ncbi:MAG: preprotein translocase subunit SecG [Dysgonamonadaceae bacterium]|jgi:preprotein translocase subunit SecG|nr:preprotein translocase subunit SecG [Dysgonamonadaceae bacterium]
MYIFISILIVFLALLLVLIVIVQNSKGGGLAAGFSSSNQVMGVRKTTDFLEKATWGLAGAIVVLCIGASIALPRGQNVKDTGLKEEIQNRLPAADQNAVSPFETPVSEGGQAPIAIPEE